MCISEVLSNILRDFYFGCTHPLFVRGKHLITPVRLLNGRHAAIMPTQF